jgi:hypothetical protein
MTQTVALVGLAIQGAGPSQGTANQQRANTRDMQNAARELGDAIRANVDQHIIQARAEAAARAALAQTGGLQPVPPLPPVDPRTITIRGPNGQTIVTAPGGFNDVIPPQAVDISIAFFITIAVIIIGLPLARAFARRMDRRTAGGQVPTEIASQIAHLNQAVDAIAVEVERISEGQRFTTRLLTEQRDSRQTLPSAAGR